MQLTLTPEESRLLLDQLTRRADDMEAELVHTDKRDLQRDLAKQLQALRALTERIQWTAGPGSSQDASSGLV